MNHFPIRAGVLLAIAVASIGPAESQPADLQLFLLIGQSNMAGRGLVEPQDREPIPHVFSFNKEMSWVPAVDPLHWDIRTAGVGVGRSFAKALLAVNSSVSIGLIPSAVGSTSLNQWTRGGELYNNALRRTQRAMKSGRLRGILWHQGEGDSIDETDAKTYLARWSVFIRDLRSDLGLPNVPVLVGELGEFNYHRPDGKTRYARTVNEQLALLPLSVAGCGFVSSSGLVHKGDYAHFDSPSVRELGRRYACAFLALDPAWAPLSSK
jgi:hypothetical protein